ncbi:MAG TPA: glycosyltransferase family 4 protein [Thermoanaerobaculia bacterium]|nr:glycosyltransferase family 4 protein [Thermoanaerobaculia bacterium]
MRILMVIHTLWSRDLGAPRVQLELAEEMRFLGHEVEKFSYEDAFPRLAEPRHGAGARLRAYLGSNLSFAARAAEFVGINAGRFDVVDANQTDLPFPKRRLGFQGLLVARSVGLIPAYHQFERFASARWPEPASVRQVARLALTYPGRRRRLRDVVSSFRCADLINVSNGNDQTTVAEGMGFGSKVVMFPFGLSEERRGVFISAKQSDADRLAARKVAFIGAWNSRKGAKDWPQIAERVLARLPAARFLFLGTGHDREYVLRDFPPYLRSALEVIPSYRSNELPGLLASATVGAFPGYLEGFGFAVLEKLAAGLPTVAYDAPGPREMMRWQALKSTVPAGDVASFADLLVKLLTLSPDHYAEHSADSIQVAARFSWQDIARATSATYQEAWERLRESSRNKAA